MMNPLDSEVFKFYTELFWH